PRFTAYLMKNRLAGAMPACASPSYVRDNIHVSLLAKVYAQFAKDLADVPGFTRINPSGYVESQGAFTLRLAEEMRPRLNLPCPVELKKQTDFPEPRVRINTDFPDVEAVGWNESTAWDGLAAYYQR
ncbi:MAG: NAD(P)-dependent oxidoreductase, partial [Isosphaeraceae bacterium]